ncbi:MAG: phage terminase large subunit [Pseudomonadota bacterium]|nr:phage terminase large subunit [Pseudomonadota bacterium]
MSEGAELVIDTPRVFAPLLPAMRYKGAKGGRGSGKSTFFAELCVERSYAEKLDIVCIREVQLTLAQSVKKLIEAKIQQFGLGQYFDVRQSEIRSARGGVMIFRGMQDYNAESIKSLEGFDVAWVEEAQSLSRRSLDLLRPTIRKPGSELWFSWNPNEPDDPVEEFLCGGEPPPGACVVEAQYWHNPWFPDVLRAEMEYDRKRDADKYQHVWCGQYRKLSEALVFKNWRVEEFERPAATSHRFGADWGFATDPTVLVRCDLDERTLYVDHEAHMVGCEIDLIPGLFDKVPLSRKFPIRADSARPETISYLRRNGFPRIEAATKGTGSVEDGVEFLKTFDIVVHPRCVHTIGELKSYAYKVDKLTQEVLPILEDKNNHVIDALRYACEGARRAAKVAGPKRSIVRRAVGGNAWMGA